MLKRANNQVVTGFYRQALVAIIAAAFIMSCGDAESPLEGGQDASPSVENDVLVTAAPTVHKPDQTPDPLPPTPIPTDPMAVTINVSPGPPLPPETLVQRYGTIVTGRIVESLPSQ